MACDHVFIIDPTTKKDVCVRCGSLKETKSAGRPTEYSQALADAFCAEIVSGKSFRKVCAMESMPSTSAVFNWIRKYPAFVEQYRQATIARTDTHVEDMIDIAEDPNIDVQRARLMVDTRKWIAARMQPKKYGDHTITEITGANLGPLQVQQVDAVSDTELAALALAGRAAPTESTQS